MNRIFLTGILLLSGLALGIFLTWPKYQDFKLLSFELQEREQELENKETYFADLARIKADLARSREAFSKIEAALPLDPQLPMLYDFLQTTAAFSGMSVRRISVSVESKPQDLLMRTIPVVLELTGSFGAIKELISRLDVASRMASVQSLSISGATDPGRFNITMRLHTYSY